MSRAHALHFDGIDVAGNAAPANIPPTVEKKPGVDPEHVFVAAFSSCHMLWFLHLACRAPSAEQHLALHHAAHERCFIANSVKTEIVIEPC